MIKPVMGRLVVLSDMWGCSNDTWLLRYEDLLRDRFEIQWYDCRELGRIPVLETNQQQVHAAFVNGGIQTAAQTLLKNEICPVTILGFSVGGTIAWQAALSGLRVQHLVAVSATRLRYETIRPKTTIDLFYGSDDPFKPNDEWFRALSVQHTVFANQHHECYKQPEFAGKICATLTDQSGRIGPQ